MEIKFEKKFSEQQIDKFIENVYKNFKSFPTDSYIFDLTEMEWISNQGLLLFTGLLKYFIEKEIIFKVLFIKPATQTINIPERVALQIVQIWETWGIWKIIPNYKYIEYLGIDDSTIQALKKQHKIHFLRPEIYDSYEITPFVTLNYVQNYEDSIILDSLKKYHNLNKATIEIIKENNCEHPFVNGLFGEIISKELFENFLSHFEKTIFNSKKDFAFFSLVLKGKIDEKYSNALEIQKKQEINFKTEELRESKGFFIYPETNKFKNISYISYSFLDFGIGIAETLRNEFKKNNNDLENETDAEILRYAFKYNSSRNPIKNVFNNNRLEDYIPRGLFDVLCLVKRYDGLIIVRSCYGKILYDFSNTQDIEKAFSSFGDSKLFFPGTFITLYLPAISKGKKINTSVIKPIFETPSYVACKQKFVSLLDILKKTNEKSKGDTYSYLYNELYNLIQNQEKTLIYFSFENIENTEIIKKIIFFFVANYDINLITNLVIFHPPKIELLEEINYEIFNLSIVNRNYKIHPLPFVFFNTDSNDINIYWLGIYDEQDRIKLNDLLFDQFSLAKSDFNEPYSIIGHLNYFDKYDNLESNFPKKDEIIKFYKRSELYSRISQVKDLIDNNCISNQTESIYFCNGNYYQFEYLELIKLLNDKKYCEVLSGSLFEVLKNQLENNKFNGKKYKYIAITSSSHKILDSLIKQGKINEEDTILIDNYHEVSDLKKRLNIQCDSFCYILVCDAIATGDLVKRTENALKECNCSLLKIAVIANTIDPDFKRSKEFYKNNSEKILSLYKYPIKKYLRDNKKIQDYIQKKKLIRINPYTNIPINLSINETNPNNIILTIEEFLELIEDKHIFTGFLKFNNILHPYFFNTKTIIKEIGIKLLEKIFSKKKENTIENKIIIGTNKLKIFYPKDSDIRHLDFNKFKSEILKDHSINEYELERYNTEDGWKFPHTNEHFDEIIEGNPVLLMDDGSCTGDSLTQMINEISFFNPKKITVLCLIGRVSENKREFLTLINKIRKNNKTIDVEIYFGTHWHIPTYYMDENPNTRERNWLNQLINLQNTPNRIKKIASSIYNTLEPKEKKDLFDHKYLPKYKETEQIPKKELIKVRDEIGKVIGFRFYKEDFIFFNEFIKKYETDKDIIHRYKEVELLCAAISYEPYVFDKMTRVLPDIIDKLREFIEAIIFGNPKRNNKQLELKDLTYKWDRKDFVHLFFIIFKGNNFIDKLKEDDNFSKLLRFINESKISVDYVLYKILHFFPLNEKEIEDKNPMAILPILKTIVQKADVQEDSKRQVRIFRSFTSTLPLEKNYNQQLFNLSDSFEKLIDEKNHKTSIIAQLAYMLSDVHSMNNNFDNSDTNRFIGNWKNISLFIEPILSFTQSYPSFCPYIVYKEVQELRAIHGWLNEHILSLNKDSNIREIGTQLNKLQMDIINNNSGIFKLFINPMTTNVESIIKEKIKEYNLDEYTQINSSINTEIKLMFPEFYFKDIIFESITNNFRHNDKSKGKIIINIDECKIPNFVFFKLENFQAKDYSPGSGFGSSILEYTNSFPESIFKYKSYKLNSKFIQEILIKKY